MERNVEHAKLLKQKLRESFNKVDTEHKGYLNRDQAKELIESVIKEQKIDQEYASQLLSKFPKEIMPNSASTTNENSKKIRLRSNSPDLGKLKCGFDIIGLSTDEQMIPAARIIYILRQIKEKCCLEKSLVNEINWCIEQIAIGTIYQPVSSPKNSPTHSLSNERLQALPWVSQFSTPELDMDKIQSLLQKKIQNYIRSITEERRRAGTTP